jgi:hypothetical protein
MEEDNNEPQLDKYTQERIDKGINELLEEKELKTKWRKELEQNEDIQKHFQKYNQHSINSFINTYLTFKYSWYRFGDFYQELINKEQAQWILKAHDHLKFILQKKLFDLQCLWRAEQIKIDEVKICFDFKLWGNDILNCPFLEHITQQEISLYQEYLMQENIKANDDDYTEWQNYEEIKEDYNNSDSEMPEWYEFHNTRTGNNQFLLLPNIRGQKEAFYTQLVFEKNLKILETQQNDTISNVDQRPFLSSYNEDLATFVSKFEDKDFQKKFKYYTQCNNNYSDNEYYENILSELLNTKEPIPIKAHYDIKQAIENAYHHYNCLKIANHLPIAYNQYLFNLKMGFIIEGDDKFYPSLREKIIKNILEGRVLNGEEPTLDF